VRVPLNHCTCSISVAHRCFFALTLSCTRFVTRHHMMVFKRAGKDANDVLSWWMFRFLMFTTKMIQLSMCFYMGFYVCHMNLRLQMVRWEYLASKSPPCHCCRVNQICYAYLYLLLWQYWDSLTTSLRQATTLAQTR
jgi:hypothetical protein